MFSDVTNVPQAHLSKPQPWCIRQKSRLFHVDFSKYSGCGPAARRAKAKTELDLQSTVLHSTELPVPESAWTTGTESLEQSQRSRVLKCASHTAELPEPGLKDSSKVCVSSHQRPEGSSVPLGMHFRCALWLHARWGSSLTNSECVFPFTKP